VSTAAKGPTYEKREYPRVEANCPARYTVGDSGEWVDAILLDYSATGIRLLCDDLLLKGVTFKIEVLPEAHQNVPRMIVECVVMRFALDDTGSFQIGCEFVGTVRLTTHKS
jgi:hypothetical protein